MYLNAYSMPDGFFNMYQSVKIATDKNETFAVFLFSGLGWGVKMVIFTEEGGFVPVYDTEQADKEPENVFNWCLKRSALVCIPNLSNNYSLTSG